MSLHESTFQYLIPTSNQILQMEACRDASARFTKTLEEILPDGPDKTFIMRELRGLAMWINVAITRLPDGTPRS